MERGVLILKNAALAGLAFTWMCIALGYWTRRKRPLHLAGATFMALVFVIFILRTMNVGVIAIPWAQDVIGLLWLIALIDGLIYSIVYLVEERLLIKPAKRMRNGSAN